MLLLRRLNPGDPGRPRRPIRFCDRLPPPHCVEEDRRPRPIRPSRLLVHPSATEPVLDLCSSRSFRRMSWHLEGVQTQRPLYPHQAKMADPKNFEVATLVPQAKPVIGLELIAVAGAADVLKVFRPVWIPCSQSPDQSRRHDVIHMAPAPDLAQIRSARLDFATSR